MTIGHVKELPGGGIRFFPVDGSLSRAALGKREELLELASSGDLGHLTGPLGAVSKLEPGSAEEAGEQLNQLMSRRGSWSPATTPSGTWRTGQREVGAEPQSLGRPAGQIYPYAFVELPLAAPELGPFITHESYVAGSLSGRIEVAFTSQTPLFTAGDNPEDSSTLKPLIINGRYAVAGSSLKGLLRSFHELVTGSCFRVLDAERAITKRVEKEQARRHPYRFELRPRDDASLEPTLVPLLSYRVPVRYTQRQWESFGEATRAHLPEPDSKHPAHWLQDLSQHRDGEEIAFKKIYDADRTNEPLVKVGEDDAAKKVVDYGWLKLSDVPEAETKVHQRVFTPAPDGKPAPLQEEMARAYDLVVSEAIKVDNAFIEDSATDLLLCDQAEDPDPRWGSRGPHHFLRHGDIVWGDNANPKNVTSIAPSQIHRTVPTTASIGRAVPKEFAPCSEIEELCPSCRLFGMVDPTRDRRDAPAVAGHIRPGTALGPDVGDGATTTIELPALMSPKPTHGPFYLKPFDDGQTKAGTWDRSGAEIAGRKLYWHHDTPTPRRPDAIGNEHASTVVAVDAEQQFRYTIQFDNLDHETLGTLLLACDPRLFGPSWENSCHKLGMGKPVGLGSIRAEVSALTLIDRRRRYLDLSYTGDDASDQVPELAAMGVTAVQRRLGESADHILESLRSVLSTKTTAGRSVGYPVRPEGRGYKWFEENPTEPLAGPLQVSSGHAQSP